MPLPLPLRGLAGDLFVDGSLGSHTAAFEEPFDDLLVRQAVNHAIDTSKIQKIMAGQALALNQIFPKGMPGNQGNKVYYAYDPETSAWDLEPDGTWTRRLFDADGHHLRDYQESLLEIKRKRGFAP